MAVIVGLNAGETLTGLYSKYLSCGMAVHVLERPGIPVCGVQLMYRVGSSFESSTQWGIAHFLEHMMFKGSKAFPAGELDRFSQRCGGENNAFTSRDATAYYHLLPAGQWQTALEIEADRMKNLRFGKRDLEAERAVILEEWNMVEDDPGELQYDLHYMGHYGKAHPYYHPVIGTRETISSITQKDLKDFYRDYYAPDNAILFIAGHVDAQEVFQKCEFLFGSKKPKLRKELKYPGYVESPVHLVRYADLDQIRLKISYPGFAAGSAGEVFATVIEEMLAGGRNSSLSLALKENRSLVRGVHAYHDSHYHGGLFFIDCTFESLSSIEEIEKEVQKVLDLLCKGEFHEEAVELAKTKVMASWFFEQEKLEDLLYEIAPYMLCPDPGCYFEFSSRVSEVSVEDIRGAAETMFKKGAPVKSLFLPDECEEEISEKWRESDEL